MKLSEWLVEWLENYKKPFVKKKTFIDIENQIEKLKNSKLANFELNELKTIEIQKYFNTLPRTRTKEKIFLYFNASLQKAEDLELITKNPCRAVEKDKKINNKRNALTLEEQTKLLKYIKGHRFEELIYFYLLTGCRRNEALAVLWEDLDTKYRTIHIKGTKTKQANRYVEISSKYLKHLLKLKETSTTKHIFNFSYDTTTKNIRKIFKHLNISGGCVHTLRHTFSTNQYYLGTRDKQRQEWLGHASLTMTNGVYTHIDRTMDKKKLIKLYKNFYFFN